MKVLFLTDRLIVREFQWSDWESVHVYAQMPEVSQYQQWGPNTASETKSFVKQALAYQLHEPRFHYELCVCLKDGTHIGGCGIFVESSQPKSALIGYVLHPDFWNQGYATEIVAYLVPYCLEQLQIEIIGATCDIRNIASQRVLEKNGFRKTAVKENDFLQKGIWRHTFQYTHSLKATDHSNLTQSLNAPQ